MNACVAEKKTTVADVTLYFMIGFLVSLVLEKAPLIRRIV